MRYDRDDVRWIADYTIHNMVFLMGDLKLKEHYVVAKILNAMHMVTQRDQNILKATLKELVDLKKLGLPQVKLILENVQKTFYSHYVLYDACQEK